MPENADGKENLKLKDTVKTGDLDTDSAMGSSSREGVYNVLVSAEKYMELNPGVKAKDAIGSSIAYHGPAMLQSGLPEFMVSLISQEDQDSTDPKVIRKLLEAIFSPEEMEK